MNTNKSENKQTILFLIGVIFFALFVFYLVFRLGYSYGRLSVSEEKLEATCLESYAKGRVDEFCLDTIKKVLRK